MNKLIIIGLFALTFSQLQAFKISKMTSKPIKFVNFIKNEASAKLSGDFHRILNFPFGIIDDSNNKKFFGIDDPENIKQFEALVSISNSNEYELYKFENLTNSTSIIFEYDEHIDNQSKIKVIRTEILTPKIVKIEEAK